MTLSIYQIISEIAKEAGALAPSKAGGVPFAFRGIDAVVAHLADKLDKYGVIHTAEILQKDTSTRELQGGKAITQTDLTVRYTFYSPDGSSISTEAAGLAQDYADRSAAQAQSVALRVALLQLFHLPTTDKSDEREYREPEAMGEQVQKEISKNAADNKTVAAKETPESVRAEMGEIIDGSNGKVTGDDANEVMAKITNGADVKDWNLTSLKKGRDELKALAEARK